MSYAQFGYPYHPASQILVSSQSSGNAMPPNPCCESGRVVTDPVTSQTVFSCQQCDTHSLVYPRLGSSVPTAPYTPYGPEQTYSTVGMGVDTPTAFYPSIVPGSLYPVDKGSNDVAGSWQSMQSTGYYSYDPASLSYTYGYDVNGARRKNATREATATLKAWLNEHRKNPYPTKGEKIMLAIITKMTLTQVSTWFANARRRLKKENKMTWEAKGKEDDEDDDDGKGSDDDDDTKDSPGINDSISNIKIEAGPDGPKEHARDGLGPSSCLPLPPSLGSLHMTHNTLGPSQRLNEHMPTSSMHPPLQAHHQHQPQSHHQQQQMSRYPLELEQEQEQRLMMAGGPEEERGHSPSHNKPKIWSLADTATCKTPPTASLAPQRGSSILGRPSEGQWPPSTVYQRPISSYQSVPNYAYQHQPQSVVGGSPLALLVHEGKGQSAGEARTLAPGLNQCSNNELQTDTPPQTPPNHKFPLAANGPYASRLLPHTANMGPHSNNTSAYPAVDNNNMYSNQRALISRLPEFQDDNAEHVSHNFSANNGQAATHLNSLNSSNTDNSNSNSGNSMEETAFKPVFKSSLSNNGNLVIA